MKYMALFVGLVLAACGANSPPLERNAELTVTYFDKKIKHEKPTWSSEPRLRAQLDLPGEKYIVFGASWCEACNFLRRALREGELLNKVEFINVDEDWVASVASFYKINSIPTMLVIDSKSNIISYNVGPGNIVVYLLINTGNQN